LQKEELLVKITDIIRKIASDPSLKIEESTRFSEINEWDSLNTVDMEMELENIFSISFEIGEFRELDDIDGLLNCMLEKLN
jgi:acyl carrier protein